MKTVVIAGLLLIFALPAFAQDTPTCTVDVSGVQEVLAQVQAADPETAIALVAQARDLLLGIEQSCAAAGVILLDQTFTAPEDTFTLTYPHGWTLGTFTPSTSGGILFLGSTPTAPSLLQTAEPEISAGEQAVQVLVGQPEAREGDPLHNVIADFDELIRSMYTEVSTTEFYTLDDRSAASLSFRSTGFDGVIVGVDLGDGRFVVVRGVAAPGTLEGIRAIAEAIAASAQ